MFVLYTVLIVLFAIVGSVALIIGLGEGKAKPIIIGLLFLVIIPVIALAPHSKNCESTHYVIRTDTYNNIKYDKVVRVEYDIKKGPWWSWESLGTTQNLKIITEDK